MPLRKLFILFYILLAAVICSCSPDHKISEKGKTTTLDTAKALLGMNLVEYNCDSMLMIKDPKMEKLKPELITADFTNMQWACTCPDWVYWEHRNDKQFEIDSFCVYMEPASKAVEVDYRVTSFRNRITFTGRFYKVKSLPPPAHYMEHPGIPEWYVFRYYSYQLHKPYVVRGPHQWNEKDSVFNTTEITVRD